MTGTAQNTQNTSPHTSNTSITSNTLTTLTPVITLFIHHVFLQDFNCLPVTHYSPDPPPGTPSQGHIHTSQDTAAGWVFWCMNLVLNTIHKVIVFLFFIFIKGLSQRNQLNGLALLKDMHAS